MRAAGFHHIRNLVLNISCAETGVTLIANQNDAIKIEKLANTSLQFSTGIM